MTDSNVVLITGAAGFLGSAMTAELARGHSVVGIDRREPSETLRRAAPNVIWHRMDIADRDAVVSAVRDTQRRLGRIDFVLHFAAFYHFGSDAHPEYERTNLKGTAHVLKAAIDSGARRLIFASSMVAMSPAPTGQWLTEHTPTNEDTPYGRSKSLGEQMIHESADRLPAVILRIGGAFSDWCELPPLYSLIRLWSGLPPLSNLMVGQGNTGFPYIHRHDLVRLVRACIDRNDSLATTEVFLASQHGAVVHNDLFPIVHESRSPGRLPNPFHISPAVAGAALRLKVAWGWITRNMPCERPWMLNYADRPWIADTSHTRAALDWDCTPGLGIVDRLPLILDRYHRDRRTWEKRNRVRNALNYAFQPDDVDDP